VETDLASVRLRLQEEQRRLRTEIAEEELENPEPMTYGSQAAAATQVFDQNRQRALRERALRELSEVDAALQRIDAGTYGRCKRCGQPIDPARLDALPWTPYDLECARLERG
jgi:RNA polymerase-binding transcription factor DksA